MPSVRSAPYQFSQKLKHDLPCHAAYRQLYDKVCDLAAQLVITHAIKPRTHDAPSRMRIGLLCPSNETFLVHVLALIRLGWSVLLIAYVCSPHPCKFATDDDDVDRKIPRRISLSCASAARCPHCYTTHRWQDLLHRRPLSATINSCTWNV